MARSYGQFCPVAKAAEIFCERWNALLLRNLGAGAKRFSEIHGGVPLMSPTMLSRRLKELESEGVIERRRDGDARGPSYHLTPAGEEFLPIVKALGDWGQRWTRRHLRDHEIDIPLLLWDMERSVRADAFGPGRTVVQLHFTDQPPHKRFWWMVNEAGTAQVCVKDPGFEVDLYLTAKGRDMIYIWRGDLSLDEAVDADRLDAHGPKRLVRALRDWLTLSAFAGIKSQQEKS